MKKNNFLFVIAMFTALSHSNLSNAQVGFSPVVGINLANVNTSSGLLPAAPTLMPTFQVGGKVDYKIKQQVILESGIYFTGSGYNDNYSIYWNQVTSAVTVYNLEIPLNAVYSFAVKKVSGKFLLLAGPYIKFAIAGTHYVSGLPALFGSDGNQALKFGNDITTQDQRMVDLGFNVGIGYEMKKLQFRFQYGFGLRNLEPQANAQAGTPLQSVYNRIAQVTFAYRLGGAKKMD